MCGKTMMCASEAHKSEFCTTNNCAKQSGMLPSCSGMGFVASQWSKLTSDGSAASPAKLVACSAALHAALNALVLSLLARFLSWCLGGPASCSTQQKRYAMCKTTQIS